MTPSLRAMISGAILALLLAGSASASRPVVHIDLDLRTAELVLAAVDQPSDPDAAIDRAVANPGTLAVIAKSAEFRPSASIGGFMALAHQVAIGDPNARDHDAFRLVALKKSSDDTRRVLALLADQRREIEIRIADRLLRYAPPGTELQAKVMVIAGGGADGWTTTGADDQGGLNAAPVFYVNAQIFTAKDMDGITEVMTHELFHLIQAAHQPYSQNLKRQLIGDNTETRDACSRSLLRDLMNEGTATYVGQTQGVGTGPYSAIEREIYERNQNRLEDDFTLFSGLLIQCRNGADYKKLYPLGFSSDWGSPAYYVGLRMVERLVARRGEAVVPDLISHRPEDFFLAYVDEISKTSGFETEIAFSPFAVDEVRRLRAAPFP